MQTTSVGTLGSAGQQGATGTDALRNVDLNDFLKMMIAELQNQDPLNPMDNQELLQQIGQIREIESNLRLTSTLEAMLMQQSLASAGALIGRSIVGLDDTGQMVTGIVERVSLNQGKVRLHVGSSTVELKNVTQILGSPQVA